MSKVSYGVGTKVQISKDSSWYDILQAGTITSVVREYNTFRYAVDRCAWITHDDLIVNPPPTNMTPYDMLHDGDGVTDENAHLPIHVSSGDKEWVIIGYYAAHDGHMCIDIEEYEP